MFKRHFLVCSVVWGLLALLAINPSSRAGDDLSWAKPGINVEKSRINIKVASAFSPLTINQYTGTVITGLPALDAVADAFNVQNIEKCFILTDKDKSNASYDDVNRWFTVSLPEASDPVEVVTAYNRCAEIEGAELIPIKKSYYQPNDPRFRGMWHLSHCGFPAAWDVSHGSEEVIIGIIDGGIDMDADEQGGLTIHEDLAANLWVNWGEDANHDHVINFDDFNNRDDDHNGYADDFYGWDFTGRDNWPDDPWGVQNGHGSHVAGIASAVTDNNIGVSGAGFNCKLMIVGCSGPTDSTVSNTNPGIVYCAQNGADVINCSYGFNGPPSGQERDAIIFAQRAGVIVFAAVGNNDLEDNAHLNWHHYPAWYDSVIGVAASDANDNKCSFSNYGDIVDIVAPGENILSTFPRNSYQALQGTSMASPLAAGLGALYLSVEPGLCATQLITRMQQTAVDISARNQDTPGIRFRINADFLLNSTRPRLIVSSWSASDLDGDRDGKFEPMENGTIDLTIANEAGFHAAANAYWTLENDDPYVRIDRARGDIGQLNGGEQRRVAANQRPRFLVRWNSPPHYSTFRLTINSDEDNPAVQDIQLTIGRPLYLIVDDDEGANYQSYYHTDLDARPYVHDIWTVEDKGTPTLDALNEYSFVIWETGRVQEPLFDAEQTVIQEYLDGGGALILSSQYAGDYHGNQPLFSDYLHVRHVADNTNERSVSGVQGAPFAGQMQLLLVGGSAAGNNDSPSSMEPLEGAQAIFTYVPSRAVAATYYHNDVYQVAYLGFPLEAASGAGGTTPRVEFVNSVLNHFYQVGVNEPMADPLPQQFRVVGPWPNPFNAATSVRLELPLAADLSVRVLDPSGRLINTLAHDRFSAGAYILQWEANDTPAGIYFLKVNYNDQQRMSKVILLK
ncbi:MAG: S8 family peptidase, partial [Calditrichota bacterium]